MLPPDGGLGRGGQLEHSIPAARRPQVMAPRLIRGLLLSRGLPLSHVLPLFRGLSLSRGLLLASLGSLGRALLVFSDVPLALSPVAMRNGPVMAGFIDRLRAEGVPLAEAARPRGCGQC